MGNLHNLGVPIRQHAFPPVHDANPSGSEPPQDESRCRAILRWGTCDSKAG
jgi:hypothetical protein